MNSIFGKTYHNNLSRVQGSINSYLNKNEMAPEKENGFVKVLADLEKKVETKQENQAKTDGLSTQVEHPNSVNRINENIALTNLNDAEIKQAAQNIISNPSFENQNAQLQDVNFIEESVKKLAQSNDIHPNFLDIKRASLAPLQAIPEINQILNEEDEGSPQEPEIVSIVRDNILLKGNNFKEGAYANKESISNIISTAGKFYGIDPNLGLAIAEVESNFDIDAVSRDGHNSKGIFQLLDSTGNQMKSISGVSEKYDPFDPAQNTYLGMGYLRRLHDLFSEQNVLAGSLKTKPVNSADELEKFAIAAYNSGEGTVARAQASAKQLGKDPSDYNSIEQFLPLSTRDYVRKVNTIKQALSERTKINKLA
ncbi:MAG: transglycosylase SLT domain-containing protein [Proteobacteria bacterium]|nr:transglycosylase SLT domain-containing protein [Pseudomonadota bacterium]